MVPEVLEQPHDPLQVAASNPVLFVEPVPVPRTICRLEFVIDPIADIVSALGGHPRHYVQVEVASVVDGDAASLEPQLAGIVVILLQGVVNRVDVVFGLPVGIRVHYDLDVSIVLVILVDRLDEGAKCVGTLPLHLLIAGQVDLEVTVHSPHTGVQSVESALVEIDLVPEKFLKLLVVLAHPCLLMKCSSHHWRPCLPRYTKADDAGVMSIWSLQVLHDLLAAECEVSGCKRLQLVQVLHIV